MVVVLYEAIKATRFPTFSAQEKMAGNSDYFSVPYKARTNPVPTQRDVKHYTLLSMMLLQEKGRSSAVGITSGR